MTNVTEVDVRTGLWDVDEGDGVVEVEFDVDDEGEDGLEDEEEELPVIPSSSVT